MHNQRHFSRLGFANVAARPMLLNARILHAPMTGVGRYLTEMLAAWPGAPPRPVSPLAGFAQGMPGHAWEQLVLPLRARGELLWSPVHSGPLTAANQVVTVHDVVPLDHPEWLNRGFSRWYGFMLPRLVRRARHVIAISEFTRERLIATTGLSERSISVIRNGVSERFHAPCDSARAAMRRALSLDARRFLLSVCTLEPRKNLAGLLRAWRLALPALPDDLELIIAGGPGRRSVFADSDTGELPPRVRFFGRVDDALLPALYAEAEWFVYLSRYEGFGMPPLESFACGTPAIISDIPVFRETAGDAGVFVDLGDERAIADRMVAAVSNPGLRREFAERGLSRAAGHDWRDTARHTLDVLERFGS
jgi:glycosyltransferase involved in cell wall biosynthesis